MSHYVFFTHRCSGNLIFSFPDLILDFAIGMLNYDKQFRLCNFIAVTIKLQTDIDRIKRLNYFKNIYQYYLAKVDTNKIETQSDRNNMKINWKVNIGSKYNELYKIVIEFEFNDLNKVSNSQCEITTDVIETESLIETVIGCKGAPVLGIFISILLKVEATASADLRANLRDVLRIKIIELSYLII